MNLYHCLSNPSSRGRVRFTTGAEGAIPPGIAQAHGTARRVISDGGLTLESGGVTAHRRGRIRQQRIQTLRYRDRGAGFQSQWRNP